MLRAVSAHSFIHGGTVQSFGGTLSVVTKRWLVRRFSSANRHTDRLYKVYRLFGGSGGLGGPRPPPPRRLGPPPSFAFFFFLVRKKF